MTDHLAGGGRSVVGLGEAIETVGADGLQKPLPLLWPCDGNRHRLVREPIENLEHNDLGSEWAILGAWIVAIFLFGRASLRFGGPAALDTASD